MQKKILLQLITNLKSVEELLRESVFSLNELVGEMEAGEDIADIRRSRFTMFINDKERQEVKKAKNQWGILEFTEKEIIKMPKQFRKQFRAGKITAHVRKKTNGVYEIRCQVNKQQISASHKLLEFAKEKFFEKLATLNTTREDSTLNSNKINPNITFGEYIQKWLDTVKKPYIKPVTYTDYLRTFNAIVFPKYGERKISDITAFEMQEFINALSEQGKYRTAKKIHQLLTSIFEYAVIDDIITKSPMSKVISPKYEQEHGSPLSLDEELRLVKALRNDGELYVQAFVFFIYTGLRRSELASVEVENGWITLKSSKQRKWVKEKTRSLPISPMLAPLLPWIDVTAIKGIECDVLTRWFKRFFPNHHLHDTRHTFITRAQECGIPREIVSIWAGHAADNSITTTVYTHLEKNKQLQEAEMKKFSYSLE